MPINSGYNNNDSQLLREISKLNLSGSSVGFKYIKSANCALISNQESIILESALEGVREILLIKNTPEANIELFWTDGINKVKIPDPLNDENNRYFDNSDGGLILSAKSDRNANIDIYVRSQKIINYKVGNVIEIPKIEEDFFIFNGSKEIEIIRIPIKPIIMDFPGWDYTNPIVELPISAENGYEPYNSRIIGNPDNIPFEWIGFGLKRYIFYIDNPYESIVLWINNISQDNEKWLIELGS